MTTTPHDAQELRKALDSPAVRSLQQEKREKRKKAKHKGEESQLTRGLKDSFPASDPVSPTSSTTAGEPSKDQ
jgi:hypothetical protein